MKLMAGISGGSTSPPRSYLNVQPTTSHRHGYDVTALYDTDLDSFLKEVNKIPDNTYFRLKVMTFDNVPWVATMKKNEHYFPTIEFVKDNSLREGWKRVMYDGGKKKVGEGEMIPEVVDEGGGTDAMEDGDGVVDVSADFAGVVKAL